MNTLEQEFAKLLEMTWENEDKIIIQKIIDGVMYYKRLLPKGLKTDIILALELCMKLKNKLDSLEANEVAKLSVV